MKKLLVPALAFSLFSVGRATAQPPMVRTPAPPPPRVATAAQHEMQSENRVSAAIRKAPAEPPVAQRRPVSPNVTTKAEWEAYIDKKLSLAARKTGIEHFVKEGIGGAAETAKNLGWTQGQFRKRLASYGIDPAQVEHYSEYAFTGPEDAPLTVNRPVLEGEFERLHADLLEPLGLFGLDGITTSGRVRELERIGGLIGRKVTPEDREKMLWGGFTPSALDKELSKRSGLATDKYIEMRRYMLDKFSLARRKLAFGPGAFHFVEEGVTSGAWAASQLKMTQGEFRRELSAAGLDAPALIRVFQEKADYVFTGDNDAPLQPRAAKTR